MRHTSEHTRVGLDPLDIKIFSVLHKHGPQRPYHLALLVGGVRTTIDWRQRQLTKQGWLERRKIGRHYHLELAAPAQALFLEKLHDTTFTLYESMPAVLDASRALLGTHAPTRAYFLEPSQLALVGLTEEGDEAAAFQMFIRDRGIIAEGVLGAALLTDISTEYLEYMRGRLFVMYEVPDEFLQFQDLIWVFGETTFLANPITKQYRSLTDASFAKSMTSLIINLEQFGKKIDFHRYLEARAAVSDV